MIPPPVWPCCALLAYLGLAALCPRDIGRIVLPAVRAAALITAATVVVLWLFL